MMKDFYSTNAQRNADPIEKLLTDRRRNIVVYDVVYRSVSHFSIGITPRCTSVNQKSPFNPLESTLISWLQRRSTSSIIFMLMN